MSAYALTKTLFREGVWEGLLAASRRDAPTPEITVSLNGAPVRGVTVAQAGAPGRWVVRIPIPVEAVGDGVQTVLIQDASCGEPLESFTLIAGEALGDDIRAEMALLRAELDMLKRAFRNHCRETG
ncbi:MAG: hypothetical protein GYB50_05485 [Rhodobacteraceae bacterium]|uniref:hypothetical protein n=1 Tax=Salipiger thiooxidans TaxID=282683 RepID=UPI001A8DC21D|nr:hypothetical protein [Salipiger thiooxidans]MBN8185302.1 hypothetical protein [Salipiger thiooxidans]MBR9837328.1 hypothetical protein [Paracoccaceae bacterium]